MDFRAFYKQAADAAAPAVHAEEDDEVVEEEITPDKAVLQKLDVPAGTADDVPSSSKGNGLSTLGLGNTAEVGSSGDRGLTCPECGKTFLSDKAMYGHLRSHPARGYKGASRPWTACSPAAVPGDKAPARKVRRSEVGGESPAMDMSATLPAAGENKPGAAEDEPWTTKWPVRAKRGRAQSTPTSAGSAPAAAAQSSSSSWRSPEEGAAMILLEMASGGRTASGTARQSRQLVRTRDAKHQIPEADDEQPMLLDHDAQNQTPELPQPMSPDHAACAVVAHQTPETGQQIVQLEPSPEIKELTKQLEIPTDAVVIVVRDQSTPANQQPASAASGARKRKKLHVPDLEQKPAGPASPAAANVKPPAPRIPSPASDKRHECPICYKSFLNHQALGGHMTGHKNSKRGVRHDDPAVENILAHGKRSRSTIVGGTGAVAIAGQAGAAGGRVHEGPAIAGRVQVRPAIAGATQERHYVQPPAQHACSECNKTFLSGQALGGHKKKHWHPEKQQAKTALAAAPRSFDLNELPSDAEEGSQP
jgi:hypothetical protein